MNYQEERESTDRFIMEPDQDIVANPVKKNVLMCLKDVHKIYKTGDVNVNALNGLNLELESGSFWTVMGPSGSGKSTLLNLLGCLDRCTKGSYTLSGIDVGVLNDDALSELRLRKLGFIFQSFNLIQQLTVKENIELPLYYLGWDASASADRAKELAEKVGLGDRMHHKPLELSGGEQQRVAIARSMANDPEILLADEPTGNLDSATGEQIMTFLSMLNSQGKTIVLVTHNPLLADFASYRLYMRDGMVEQLEESK